MSNPYGGLTYAELCGRRKDYAKLLHGAVAARKLAERNLTMIAQAMETIEEEPPAYEASDHAVVRYLERVRGMDLSAIRDEISLTCASAVPVIGDKMRGADGFLYCCNNEGYVTTVLPLGAVVDEATEEVRALQERPHKSGAQRRRLRHKRAFVRAASGMETRQGQDAEERLGAEHDSPTAESGDAHD